MKVLRLKTSQISSAVPVDMKQYDFYARNQQQFPVNLPDFRPEALNALYVLQTGEVITIHGQSQDLDACKWHFLDYLILKTCSDILRQAPSL